MFNKSHKLFFIINNKHFLCIDFILNYFDLIKIFSFVKIFSKYFQTFSIFNQSYKNKSFYFPH